MKRFYKEVGITSGDDEWQVTLDGRGIKTVQGAPQLVPNEALAKQLAAEWEAQGEKLDPATFPLRDMVDYALDVISADPASLAEKLLTYGDTDTLLYRADPDEPLHARQMEVWEPIVAGFEADMGVKLIRISGIIHRPQSDEYMAAMRAHLATLSPLTLAGMEVMTSLAASLITSTSASKAADRESALALWRAACLEEEWQAELWGRDEEEEARRAKREAAFLKAYEATRLTLIA